MNFKDIYTDDKVKDPNKKDISKEAYAIGTILDDILAKLEQIRIRL